MANKNNERRKFFNNLNYTIMKIEKELFGNFLDDTNCDSYWAVLGFNKGDLNRQLKAEYLKANTDAYRGEIMAYILLNGGSIVVVDTYEEDEHTLTMEDVNKGFQLLEKHNNKLYNSLVKDEDYDAETCDLWLQYAVFGEIVYG